MSEDVRHIGGCSFSSRLFVGTGKYKDIAETERALAASGAEVVTVAVRRVNLQERGEGSMMSLLPRAELTILPNTAGCYTAEEALRTARLARELCETDLVKLEGIGGPRTLFPDTQAKSAASE